jgi:hypothetical protein
MRWGGRWGWPGYGDGVPRTSGSGWRTTRSMPSPPGQRVSRSLRNPVQRPPRRRWRCYETEQIRSVPQYRQIGDRLGAAAGRAGQIGHHLAGKTPGRSALDVWSSTCATPSRVSSTRQSRRATRPRHTTRPGHSQPSRLSCQSGRRASLAKCLPVGDRGPRLDRSPLRSDRTTQGAWQHLAG